MARGLRYKTLRWKWLEEIEPSYVVAIKSGEILKGMTMAQVTIRMHSKQVRSSHHSVGFTFWHKFRPVLSTIVSVDWCSVMKSYRKMSSNMSFSNVSWRIPTVNGVSIRRYYHPGYRLRILFCTPSKSPSFDIWATRARRHRSTTKANVRRSHKNTTRQQNPFPNRMNWRRRCPPFPISVNITRRERLAIRDVVVFFKSVCNKMRNVVDIFYIEKKKKKFNTKDVS